MLHVAENARINMLTSKYFRLYFLYFFDSEKKIEKKKKNLRRVPETLEEFLFRPNVFA